MSGATPPLPYITFMGSTGTTLFTDSLLCAAVFCYECGNESFALFPHPRPTILTLVVLRVLLVCLRSSQLRTKITLTAASISVTTT
jgi:hypothetical protein